MSYRSATSVPNRSSLLLSLEKSESLEREGKYDLAYEEFSPFWPAISSPLPLGGLSREEKAGILRLCGALAGYIGNARKIRGSQEISRKLLNRAKKIYEGNFSLKTRPDMLEKIISCENWIALSYQRNGEFETAHIVLDAVENLALPESSRERLFSGLVRTIIYSEQNDFQSILHHAESNLESIEKCRFSYIKACYLNNLGLAFKNAGQASESIEFFLKAQEVFIATQHKLHLAMLCNNLASAYFKLGKYTKAHHKIITAQTIFRQVRDSIREAWSYDTQAQIFISQGLFDDAIEAAGIALGILDGSDSKKHIYGVLQTKLTAEYYAGRDFEAAFSEAAKAAEETSAEVAAQFEAYIEKLFANPMPEKARRGGYKKVAIPLLLKNIDFIESSDGYIVVSDEEAAPGDKVVVEHIESGLLLGNLGIEPELNLIILERPNKEPLIFGSENIRKVNKVVGICPEMLDYKFVGV